MHPQALSFVAGAKAAIPDPGHVVEFGSYDVNGSPRQLFPETRWHGIDIRAGRGVDEVADCRYWDGREQYDLVVTTEMLEHCPAPQLAVDAAWRALKPGGHLIATMAAPDRAPHDGNGDPWTPGCGEHYENITASAMEEWLTGWDTLTLVHDQDAGDLRVLARKPE
jgi:SAM-dependent methyltransferase